MIETCCPDCDAPMLTGAETCALTQHHARRVCDAGRNLWAAAIAADEAGDSVRAVRLDYQFREHRKACGACKAGVS